MRGVSVHLFADDIARILGIPLGGWDHYVRFDWPSLNNLASTLTITKKFLGNPNLAKHRRVLKREMSPLHHLYFGVVHIMVLPQKERRSEEKYLDLTLMELLDSMVKINLPSLIIKHMQMILLKNDKKAHALAYGFRLGPIFEDCNIPIQVWSL